MNRKKTNGFTIIELLVVVTIIVLLISILVPSMESAVTQAHRAACAANLHGWGLALFTYTAANKQVLPVTSTHFGGRYPTWISVSRADSAADEISVEMLAPYVAGGDHINYQLKGLWRCPSNQADRDKYDVYNKQFGTSAGHRFMISEYAIFTRVGDWEGFATQPDDLTNRKPASGELLMSDGIFRWGAGNNNGGWYFNHGEKGSSTYDPALGGPTHYGEPPLSGANQLYGDGGTFWKEGDEFETALMETNDASIGWVRGGADDRTYY